MTFLILLAAFFVLAHRRRRWRGWWEAGPDHFPAGGGPRWTRRQVASPPRADLESHVDSLETRIAQLEERLDFTERLVTGRPGPVDWRAEAAARRTSHSLPEQTGQPGGDA